MLGYRKVFWRQYSDNVCTTLYQPQANLLNDVWWSTGTLNLNDDLILGYDLYSSALAEILSEPSLRSSNTDHYGKKEFSSFKFKNVLSRVSMRNGGVVNQHC